MQYVRLGNSGLQVSRLCLGTMTYGDNAWREWALSEEDSRPFIKQALDLGINFFDTADAYSKGTSEEYVGRALKDFAKRDEIVIATKLFGAMGPGRNQRGLSRKHVFEAVDNSLRRLGTDFIDLYQIHRWDDHTPIEETLETLNDVVRAGKVRYIGASSMFAWQFSKALYTSEMNGWAKFISMQNFYNLLYREEEREMLPLCADQGIGVIPWSPMARGFLVREDKAQTVRMGNDPLVETYGIGTDADYAVRDAVAKVAKRRGATRVQVALAWLFSKPVLCAPIIGASKEHHLPDAAAALDFALSEDDITDLEAPYQPRRISGHS